ncbi:hypothetical protein AZ78_0149 [Lysobacter capsici AZ78]|uniref:Uncharacterized protein n=1 Tax=Lysobacter capsici AZ78 TaxID=1444315 RepID=A0A108U4V2_9GAMM|nr:hypothetical protein AZ78_0149 [Lysobacter capsici AZ78]
MKPGFGIGDSGLVKARVRVPKLGFAHFPGIRVFRIPNPESQIPALPL